MPTRDESAETTWFETPVGWVGLNASARGITEVLLGQGRRSGRPAQKPHAQGRCITSSRSPRERLLREAMRQLVDLLQGRRREVTVPVDLSVGTAFQRRVWRCIARIPYGRLRSYQWVAIRVGGKQYARAVGTALGANPVPLIIPCHRIVAQDGSLGGFSCGRAVKRRLLALEGALALVRST